MPIFIRMNGLWKEVEQPYVKVDGKIRTTDVYTRVDGKPRLVFGKVKASEIIGFRMVYYVKQDAEYIDIPDLKFNPNLPVRMSPTDHANHMDDYGKGVVYEFFDTNVNEEGILMYEGRLLAMLKNGMLLDIFGNPDPIPGLDAPLVTKSMDFTLSVTYDVRYQGYGLHTRGWNSMWSSTQFLKPDTTNANYFHEDVRFTSNHMLVPVGDTSACRELRAIGLKDLTYDRAASMVKEVMDLDDDVDRSTYAASTYFESDVQCPGLTNSYISYERAREIWELVNSNKEITYNDGLFRRMCEALGVSPENDTPCSIYTRCKLGYLTYRAALGEPDCPEYEALKWPSMSLMHASDLFYIASRNCTDLNPEYVADDLYDDEERMCPGRDDPPLGYLMAGILFNAVWSRRDKLNDDTPNEILDELGVYEEASDYCALYGSCRYNEVSYGQCIYFKSCGEADVTTDDHVIPEDTSSICEIGIARSLHTKDHHMQGARGVLSQNIYSISLDGVTMPFIIQVI